MRCVSQYALVIRSSLLGQAWDRMQPGSGLIGYTKSMTQEIQGILKQEAGTNSDTAAEMKIQNYSPQSLQSKQSFSCETSLQSFF